MCCPGYLGLLRVLTSRLGIWSFIKGWNHTGCATGIGNYHCGCSDMHAHSASKESHNFVKACRLSHWSIKICPLLVMASSHFFQIQHPCDSGCMSFLYSGYQQNLSRSIRRRVKGAWNVAQLPSGNWTPVSRYHCCF